MRNLGGIIIIDFIDMDEDSQREAVLDELQKAVARDRARTGVNGFTPLGLVEMTRKRTRESLAHVQRARRIKDCSNRLLRDFARVVKGGAAV